MKRSAFLFGIFGFALTSLLGVLLHFLYDATGKSILAAPFSGVNESTFEHMKLLFWPLLIYAIIERRFFRERLDFWCVKLRGILLALSIVPVLFYTYNGVIGKSPDYVNISIFFIAIALSFIYETSRFHSVVPTFCRSKVALIIIVLIAFSFVLFTFSTPEIGLFRDPVTGGYGI